MGPTWVTRQVTDESRMEHGLRYRCVIDKSNSVTCGSQMNYEMSYRWIVYWCQMNHKWVTGESHISYTFEYMSHLLLQTYQFLTPSQPCHTSDTKNECNFRPTKRK